MCRTIQKYMLYICIILQLAQAATAGDIKIVGGEETTIAAVPYLVNLRLNGRFICGGSLITKNCVLTAAHCVQDVNASDLTVHAGSSLLSEPGVMREVQKYFTSPFFKPSTLDMDVAVLKLTNSLLSSENIATIPLCNVKPRSGQSVEISGWGITNENSRVPPNQVRAANVRVLSPLECLEAYVGQALITTTMFCATEAGIKDSCSGDSGGPVVYNGQLCGIVSWGIGCARARYPGVYTNVSSRRVNAFVRQIIAGNC